MRQNDRNTQRRNCRTTHAAWAVRTVQASPLQNDAVTGLTRIESPFITAEHRVYLRDTSDHSLQLLDVLEA